MARQFYWVVLAARIIRRMLHAVEKLEQRCAAWLGLAGGVAAGFGRSALALGLEAVGVRGGEVLVPDFICAQVPEAVRLAGGRPVFYPVGRNLTVDAARFCEALSPRTRAAIVVHWFGSVLANVAELAASCRDRGIPLLEDCALALGARRDGRLAGTFGDLAVFSFTKSDWCYGGGLVASRSPALLESLRTLRPKLRPSKRLLFRYGVLRRADFASNRPRWSYAAERAGRWFERAAGLPGGNFYDAGRFDAEMTAFAARRCLRLLANLPSITAQRRRILNRLTGSLREASHILFRQNPDPGGAATFLLIQSPAGRAEEWRERAASDGLALRLTWPAYQRVEPSDPAYPARDDIAWLAEHLLLLEVHPRLTTDEVERIAGSLERLAAAA